MNKRLQLVRPVVVCRNMTRTELIRAAEHAFPTPSPIVHLMLEALRGVSTLGDGSTAESSACRNDTALNCPGCGSALQTDI